MMAHEMQVKEYERQRFQKNMHFKMMTEQWDEMKKSKEELSKIEKIFK